MTHLSQFRGTEVLRVVSLSALLCRYSASITGRLLWWYWWYSTCVFPVSGSVRGDSVRHRLWHWNHLTHRWIIWPTWAVRSWCRGGCGSRSNRAYEWRCAGRPCRAASSGPGCGFPPGPGGETVSCSCNTGRAQKPRRWNELHCHIDHERTAGSTDRRAVAGETSVECLSLT